MRNVGFEIVYFAFIELVLYWKKKKKKLVYVSLFQVMSWTRPPWIFWQTMVMKSLTTVLIMFTLILKCSIIKLQFMYVNSIGKIHGRLPWIQRALRLRKGEIYLVSLDSLFLYLIEFLCVLQAYFSLCFFFKVLLLF